jgi:hypothetical protein
MCMPVAGIELMHASPDIHGTATLSPPQSPNNICGCEAYIYTRQSRTWWLISRNLFRVFLSLYLILHLIAGTWDVHLHTSVKDSYHEINSVLWDPTATWVYRFCNTRTSDLWVLLIDHVVLCLRLVLSDKVRMQL